MSVNMMQATHITLTWAWVALANSKTQQIKIWVMYAISPSCLLQYYSPFTVNCMKLWTATTLLYCKCLDNITMWHPVWRYNNYGLLLVPAGCSNYIIKTCVWLCWLSICQEIKKLINQNHYSLTVGLKFVTQFRNFNFLQFLKDLLWIHDMWVLVTTQHVSWSQHDACIIAAINIKQKESLTLPIGFPILRPMKTFPCFVLEHIL